MLKGVRNPEILIKIFIRCGRVDAKNVYNKAGIAHTSISFNVT
jgi:hypothetical protein